MEAAMIRKILSFSVVVALLVVAGTACKKQDGEAGDTTYISDPPSGPLGGTVPDLDEDKDPCLAKGAVGAQALLLKSDCAKLGSPKCGDGNKDTGEYCDDGGKNGLTGSKCSLTCKLVTTNGGGGATSPDGTVTVKTTTLPPAYLGASYNSTIEATCNPAPCSFELGTDVKLPDSFKLASGKIWSSKIVAALGNYPISIVVKNKNGSQSATQVLTLAVQKHLKVQTFVEGFSGFEVVDENSDKKLNADDYVALPSDSDERTFVPITKDGKLVVWPSHYSTTPDKDNANDGCTGVPAEDAKANDCRPDFGYIVLGVNFKDPIDNDLSAGSDADVAAKYTWSVKGEDGEDLPDVIVKQAYSAKAGKSVDYKWVIVPDTSKGFDAYYKDLEFKNIKINVSDDKGNLGDLAIADLIFKAPLDTKAEIDARKLAAKVASDAKTKDQNDKCAAFGIESIDYAGENLKPTAEGKTNTATPDANHFLLKTSVGNLQVAHDIKINWKGGTPPYKIFSGGVDNVAYVSQAQAILYNDDNWTLFVPQDEGDLVYNPEKSTISVPALLHSSIKDVVADLRATWTAMNPSSVVTTVKKINNFGSNVPKEWRDAVMFAIKDSASGCEAQNVSINRVATYPSPLESSLKEVKQFNVEMGLDDLDGDSKVLYKLQGEYHKDFATSGDISVESVFCDGGDDCYATKNVTFSVLEDTIIKDVVNIHMDYTDPGSGFEMNVWPYTITLVLEDYQIEFDMGHPNIECEDACQKEFAVTPFVKLKP